MLLSVLLSHHLGLRSVTNPRTRIVSVDVESKCFQASSWDTPCVADWEDTENHSLDHRHPRQKVQVARNGGHHNARKLHLPVLMEPQRGRTRCPSTGSVTDNFKTLTRRATSKQATISLQHAVLWNAKQRRTKTVSGAWRVMISTVIMLNFPIRCAFLTSLCSQLL